MSKRTNAQTWALVRPESFRDAAPEIGKIRDEASSLAAMFRFKDDFDLADALIGVLYQFTLDSSRPPTGISLREHRIRMEQFYGTGSIDGAMPLDLVALAVCGRNVSDTTGDASEVRKLVRRWRHMNDRRPLHKRGGRYSDESRATACRSLAIIYFRGTGKLPTSGKTRGKYRGTYFRFARASLALLGIYCNEDLIQKYMLFTRKRLESSAKS